jgi:hypothetical protein
LIGLHESDLVLAEVDRRLGLARTLLAKANAMLRLPVPTERDDLLIHRAGYERAIEAGEDLLAAGAGLRRWGQAMAATIDAKLGALP